MKHLKTFNEVYLEPNLVLTELHPPIEEEVIDVIIKETGEKKKATVTRGGNYRILPGNTYLCAADVKVI